MTQTDFGPGDLAGLDAVARRVTGITLTWETRRGLYRQRLDLGAV